MESITPHHYDYEIGREHNGESEVPIEDMRLLLDEHVRDYRTLRRGDVVDGVVMSVDRDGILVDIGYKSEGVIPNSEVQTLGPDEAKQMRVGDEVLVYVMQAENQEGQAVLSIDRARSEKGWRILQKRFEDGEVFEAPVVDQNKGGLIVSIDGVRGFVPTSQVVGLRTDPTNEAEVENKLSLMMGRTLRLKVIEINRRRNRLILSERAAVQEWRAQQKDRLLQELQPGQVRKGRVSSISNFGAFIDLGGADGLVHLSEISWERIDHPSQVLSVGDEVDVYVMNVDPEAKKIALSIRRAQPEPWSGINEKYVVGQLVTGTVTKLAPFGAFVRIEEGIEGLVHVSELEDKRISHPKEVVKEGDELAFKIVRIEPERHRLALSLKQANEEVAEE